jgi:hypothetical protein
MPSSHRGAARPSADCWTWFVIRERQTNYFPFDMYTQLPLAYALLSAKLGNLASSEQELDRYISRLKVDDDASVKLKQLAREYAGNTTGAA